MKPRKPFKGPEPLPAALPSLHALLSPAVAHTFDTLRIGATLRDRGGEWHAIHAPPSVTGFELAHGKGTDRNLYNERCFVRVYRERKTVHGKHAGFHDFYVPIAAHGTVHAVLATGPFSISRPTSSEILERWHWLTGRHPHPSDPEFSHYLEVTLDTLVLEGEQLGRYQRLLECFAKLSAGLGDARALASEAGALRAKLEQARYVDWMWSQARTMVDERTRRVWLSEHKANDLTSLGVDELPEHVLVGLLAGHPEQADPLGEVLGRDAFQRAAVDIARRSAAICGRVGDHGVMFLVGPHGSVARARRVLARLGEEATTMARRRFGFSLHLGVSAASGSQPITVRYEEALAAAERALSQGAPLVHAEPGAHRVASPIGDLREELGAASEERPKALISRFERYIEAVTAYCGYRPEPIRWHLEAGFERAAQALQRTGALEEKGHRDLFDALDRSARDATTVSELVGAYRRAISDLVEAAEKPVVAARDRSLRRALAFIQQHVSEPLSLTQVSRVAGFAPRHFSRLFKQRERMTFEHHVRQLRVERAKDLLAGTDLSVERVGQLSGFSLRPYFQRVFKQITRMTPNEFRNSKRPWT
jgi:AraC-like DNA-binding protein